MAAFNSIKKILSALLICAGFVPVCLAVTATEASQQKRPSAWELLRKYTEQQAKVTAPQSEERIVHFPTDRTLGTVWVQDADMPRQMRAFFHWSCETDGRWECLGPARGDVFVPAGKRVKLTVGPHGWRDLSPLLKLAPDDIYELGFAPVSDKRIGPRDECLSYVKHLTGLSILNLSWTNLSSSGMKHVTGLSSLKRMYLPDRITDSGLAHVAKLTSLKGLYFWDNGVTNRGLANLVNLKLLEELTLGYQISNRRSQSKAIGDEGLVNLAQLPKLQCLLLFGDRFSNAGLAHLKNVPSLRHLTLFNLRQISDEGAANLSGLDRLESLSAYDSCITDKGLAALAKLRFLKALNLGKRGDNKTRITDNGLAYLESFPRMEHLHLDGITDKGIAGVSRLDNLKYLWVGGRADSPLTDESLRYVGKLKNLEQLFIGGVGFSDKGMKHIAKLTNLKSLTLFNADQLTNKGLAELAGLVSLTNLDLGGSTKISVSGLKSLNSLKKLKDLTIQNVKQDNSIMDISGLTALEDFSIGLHRKHKGRTIVYESSFQDKDLACLANLTRLKKLWLSGAGISDEGIKHLSGLTNLESLGIAGQCRITDVGLKHLANMQKLYRLQIMDGHFTDKALEYLEDLPSLRWLELTSDNAFSRRAIRDFKEKNSNLEQLRLVP